MKVINGKGAVMGRVAAYAAKELLKGEEISIVNCEQMIITGSRKNITSEFEATRKRVGSAQGGPKVSRMPEQIVKRTVRGMLPNARMSGRGRNALKKIKCYVGIPKEFEKAKIIDMPEKKSKFITVKELGK